MEATAAEIAALTEMLAISRSARGEHEALANVRREAAQRIDAAMSNLASRGVDIDALWDQIDPE